MKKFFSLILIGILTLVGFVSFSGCTDMPLKTIGKYEGVEYTLNSATVTNTYQYSNNKFTNNYLISIKIKINNTNNFFYDSCTDDLKIVSNNNKIKSNLGSTAGSTTFVNPTTGRDQIPAETYKNLTLIMQTEPLTREGDETDTEAKQKFLDYCNAQLEKTVFTLYIDGSVKLIDFKVTVSAE